MKKMLLFGSWVLLSLLFMPSDSEAALKLMNVDDIKVGYDDGFVLNVQDQFSIRFKAYLQFQHRYVDVDGPSASNISTFKIAKGRLRWNGFMYNPNIGYVIQLEVANGSGPKNVALKDFLIDIKHYKHVKVRLGQFKVPFNRQQLAFFGDLQFVDTAHASQQFNANLVNARDIGISFIGEHQEHRIEYFVGIFNGNGLNGDNDSSKYLSVLRVVFNPFGRMSISESDVEETEEKRLSVGAGIAYDAGDRNASAIRGSARTLAFEIAFKHRGKSIQGEYFFRDHDRNIDADGGYIQGGFFLVPQKIELAGRFSQFSPDGSGNDISEMTGGINFFFAGHRRKLQFDITSLSFDAGDRDDFMVRSQYQASF
ncbi:MAG: porin [Nitrospiria bacterium]